MTGLLRAAYAVYLLVVAWLVWNPDSGAPGSAVLEVARLLRRIGLPSSETGVEIGLNVLLFVPLSALGAYVVHRWRVLDWLVSGLLASLLIEGVQLVALPSRSATVSDLGANTAGALVGIGLARLSRRVPALRRAVPPR